MLINYTLTQVFDICRVKRNLLWLSDPTRDILWDGLYKLDPKIIFFEELDH